ncbi:MAG: LysR family glycine cleavage system transcriptional activator [Halieaceae bacterium]|jgi:LysR family glycine cleavage system transcriptional activator
MKREKSRVSLRGIRTFCIVAQHNSFILAAEDLFLTPSAISHQIKGLEDELDVKLFDRGSRGVSLTEAGDSLFSEAAPLIAKLDKVASTFQARFGQRPLRVTLQPFFATELLVPRLASFVDEHPDIAINIDTEDQSSEKHPAQADISIRLFRKPPENLLANQLFPLRLVPACSPSLREKLCWDEGQSLENLPLIIHSKRANAWRDWARKAGVELGEHSGAIRMETMISVARAAEQGLGVALVPLPLSESWFQSGSLVRLSDHELDTADCYFMVVREKDAVRAEVQSFRAWILQEFGQTA